jgi:hypothetical protein
MAGGLPTSQVEGMKELKIATYRLDSAVSFNKRYARRARLDIVSKAIERMAQEILVKQERNAWAVILRALAEASTDHTVAGATTAQDHLLMAADVAKGFQLADLNAMMTLNKRINESFSSNTPIAPYSTGITDLYVSPEVKESIRAFAYNPLNTTGGAGALYDQTLPDNIRSDIYNQAGMQSIYGVNIVELVEFGVGKKYNTLFSTFGSVTTDVDDATAGNQAFSAAAGGNQILVGIDNSRGAFIRPVARQHDSGGDGTFRALPDEQFNMYGARVEKTGFYGFLEEGRICIDARAIMGLIL